MHLAGAKESVHMSECNNHWAVNQANASRHKLEATGIERRKHRVNDSSHLSIPASMEIVPGIGLWHVHGHQDKCYVQYASTFITGAARINEEIMETLWVPLNIISPSARGISTPHRQECGFLCQKYQEAVKGVSESMTAFEMLNETTDPAMVKAWVEQDREAQLHRSMDPLAMDIFDIQLQKAPMRKQQELALLSSQTSNGGGHAKCGAATWITSGITIEELQISLLINIQRLGKYATEMQHLEIVRHHTKLQSRINEFTTTAVTHFGEDFDLDDNIRDLEVEFIDDSEGKGDVFTKKDHDSNHVSQCNFFHLKKVVIPLPSNIGIKRCTELGVIYLVGQKVALWEGQANDTLQAIQVLLADKAVLFHTTVHPVKSQAKSTRAWTQAQLSNLQAHNLLEKYL
ncbi:hypothetical protein BDR06DRAFT_968990 [Suillus hirtellus]|nr:hypothetical protein BDR06DRAFT_968990 [Suillus hirtellus]